MNVHGTQPKSGRGYGVKYDTSSVNPSNSVTCGSVSLFPFLGVSLGYMCTLSLSFCDNTYERKICSLHCCIKGETLDKVKDLGRYCNFVELPSSFF